MMRLRLRRRTRLPVLAAVFVLAMFAGRFTPLFGQMHKVAQPEQVVRAVGVYEWTGDMAKPTASRLIPVSLFIENHLEDAGVYLARPVPFALDTGTVYEIEQAGMPKGTVSLEFARHLLATGDAADDTTSYDDGWFGYGTFQGPPRPRPILSRKPARPTVASKTKPAEESDRPTFARRPGGSSGSDTSTGSTAKSGSASPSNTPSDDPDRPHLTRRTGSGDTDGSSTQTSSTSPSAPPTNTPSTSPAPASTGTPSTSGSDSADDDPDRPKFARRPGASPTTDAGGANGSTASGQSTGGNSAGSAPPSTTGTVPSDDPDRPTLKKRTPAEAKEARKQSEQSNVQGATASLNDDPDRPKLERGRPAHPVTSAGFATLKGLPNDLHQMVAVSDAKTREPHDFARPWEDDAERTAILTQMEALARAQVAVYDARQTPAIRAEVAASDAQAAQAAQSTPSNSKAASAATATASAAASASAAARKGRPATTSRTAAARKKAAAARAALPLALEDEELKGYTLSYGGAATFVYAAHTAGAGVTLRYVTIVAQKDALGALKPAIESVTDAAHLDRTPRMRLVDVVDAEASNRASLLFELRGENEREFGLYRVIAAHAEQTFLTGTTQ